MISVKKLTFSSYSIWLGFGIQYFWYCVGIINTNSCISGCEFDKKLIFTPSPWQGDATLLRFFCDAPRTMKRNVLKFSIAYGASVAQLLVKKLTGSCQVTELWRHKWYKVRPFLRGISKYGSLEGDIEASFDYFRSELTLWHRHHIFQPFGPGQVKVKVNVRSVT